MYAASHAGAAHPYLWRLPIAAGGRPERIDAAGPVARTPAVARAGGRLAFTRGIYDVDVWVLEGAGSPRPLLRSTQNDRQPDLSPDGRRIAFCSDRASESLEVFVADADGSNAVQLTDRLGREQCGPRWSPDGKRIAFDSMTEAGDLDVLVVDAAGGPARRLASSAHYESLPSWSRDGRYVYFTSDRSGRFEIWRVPADGGDAVQVTDQGGVTSFESADGRTLLYVKDRVDRQPLFARTLGTAGERQVLPEIVGRFFAVDDAGVLFVARVEPSGRALRHLDIATGRVRERARLDVQLSQGLTTSRDGRTILFAANQPLNDDLYLIENFR